MGNIDNIVFFLFTLYGFFNDTGSSSYYVVSKFCVFCCEYSVYPMVTLSALSADHVIVCSCRIQWWILSLFKLITEFYHELFQIVLENELHFKTMWQNLWPVCISLYFLCELYLGMHMESVTRCLKQDIRHYGGISKQ